MNNISITPGDFFVFYLLEKETKDLNLEVFSPAIVKKNEKEFAIIPFFSLKIITGDPVINFINMIQSATNCRLEHWDHEYIKNELTMLSKDYKKETKVFLCI